MFTLFQYGVGQKLADAFFLLCRALQRKAAAAGNMIASHNVVALPATVGFSRKEVMVLYERTHNTDPYYLLVVGLFRSYNFIFLLISILMKNIFDGTYADSIRRGSANGTTTPWACTPPMPAFQIKTALQSCLLPRDSRSKKSRWRGPTKNKITILPLRGAGYQSWRGKRLVEIHDTGFFQNT